MSAFEKLPKKQQKEVERFLKHINKMGDYWNGLKNLSSEDKVRGMLFTFLVMLDGGDMEYLNGFKLVNKETGVDVSIGYLHEIQNKFG